MEHGVKAAKAFAKLIRQTTPKDGKPGRNRSLVIGTTPAQPVVLVSAKKPTNAVAELKAMSKKLGSVTPIVVSQVVFEEGEVRVKALKAANEAAVKKAFLTYFKEYKVAPPSLKVVLVQPGEWDPVEFEEGPEDEDEDEDETEEDNQAEADGDEDEDVDGAAEEEEDEDEEKESGATTAPAASPDYQKQIVEMVESFKKVSAAVGSDPAAAKLLQAAKLKLGEANANLKSQNFEALTAALSVTKAALVRALSTKTAAPPAGAAAPGAAASATGPTPPPPGADDDDDALEAPPPFGEAIKKKLASIKRFFTPSKDFPPEPSAKELQARQTVITAVSQKGGTADDNDVALVGKEFEKLPSALLKLLETSGMKITACRGSVTDHMTELAGVQPRGWPDGMTWDSVPGCYSPSTKQILVATKGHSTGAPEVPKTGDGHGSANLALHEGGHAINLSQDPMLASAGEFTGARTPDLEGITAYEKQAGNAGLDETFAESSARYFSGDPASAESTPNLHKYWNKNKFLKALP